MPSASFPTISAEDLLDRQYVLKVHAGIATDRESFAADVLYMFSRFQKEKNQQDLQTMVQNAEARTRRPGR